MHIYIHNKDVLDVDADTLMLPVDGSAPGLEGSIARQFMKRLGVEEMHELYAPPPYYPFNGNSYWSGIHTWDGKTHFRWICCLGMLSHDPDANHRGYIRSAFGSALASAGTDPDRGVRSACPVLTGGHRLEYVDAVYLMLSAVERRRDSFAELHIAEKDPEKFAILRDIVG